MTCSARQHSDQMVCGRCQLQWDINDPEPPACMPLAVKLTHPEYRKTVTDYIANDAKKPVDELAKEQLRAIESKTITDILDSLK